MPTDVDLERFFDEALRLEMRGDWAEAAQIYDAIASSIPDRQEGKYATNCAARLRERQAVAEAATEKRVFAFGSLLMMGLEAELPTTCIKCNAPEAVRRRITFRWQRPFSLVGSALAILMHFVSFGVSSGTWKVHINVSLCDKCNRQLLRGKIKMGVIGAIVGLAIALLCNLITDFNRVILLPILSLVGFAVGCKFTPLIKLERIQDRFLLIRGIDEEYLGNFPKYPSKTEICNTGDS